MKRSNGSTLMLGSSDMAVISLLCYDKLYQIPFGIDSNYSAYIFSQEDLIPEYYEQVLDISTTKVMVIDDDEVMQIIQSNKDFRLRVYRAGLQGCIFLLEGDYKIYKGGLA